MNERVVSVYDTLIIQEQLNREIVYHFIGIEFLWIGMSCMARRGGLEKLDYTG